MIGERLGHYRITAHLGAGGMGVVYRARDERLDRDVAIKVLPPESTSDPAARRDLLREARLAGKLKHPNICVVHDVGDEKGQIFIAFELVEGSPLSERIAESGGGLPAETVLRYGERVADALSHAHSHWVIHRDLKSANVLVSNDGNVKVLDFGLARRAAGHPGASAEATLTASGVIAGTFHALAPEVLRGRPADARSDIWALGIILHEMATGDTPFRGDTTFELASAILNETYRAGPRMRPGLAAVIRRCLEKDPAQRFQTSGEVQAALRALQSDIQPLPSPPSRLPTASSLHYSMGALLLVLAAGGFFFWSSLRQPTSQTLAVQLTSNSEENPLTGAALSPDGPADPACGRYRRLPARAGNG